MHFTSVEDAEDLVVEVFMAALENAKFAALSEKEKQLWLWRVTRNKVIDTYRRAKTRQNVTLEHVADGLFEDEMAGPEYAALRQEVYMDLYVHLQSLPPLQQQILRMRFGQDLSCSEIATRLGKQENVVRPNSVGGTVQFEYTVNNGRGQTPASITFSSGQTIRTYTFTWSGALPADHTYPGPGGIQVTSPNQLTSPIVAPTGMCS
jgi:RNA polymerase sigma factor (sigma-70 family)